MIMIIAIIYILLSYVIFDQQLKIRKVSENPQPPQKKPPAPPKIQKRKVLTFLPPFFFLPPPPPAERGEDTMVTFATQLLQLIKILTMHTSFTTPAQVWNRLALCYILTFSLLHLSFLKELILAMINSIYQSQLVTFPVQATLWYIKGYISSLHINLYVMVKLDNFLQVKKKHFSGLHLPTDICNWTWAILVVYTPATFPLTIKT